MYISFWELLIIFFSGSLEQLKNYSFFQGHSQLLAAANKHGPNIWFTLQNLDIKFKYIFQVNFIHFNLFLGAPCFSGKLCMSVLTQQYNELRSTLSFLFQQTQKTKREKKEFFCCCDETLTECTHRLLLNLIYFWKKLSFHIFLGWLILSDKYCNLINCRATRLQDKIVKQKSLFRCFSDLN